MAEQDSSVSYQFTKLGNDLSVKALAGTVKLDFTKAELSTDNHFNDTEADVAIMTGMGNVAQTVELKEVDAVEDDQSYVKVPVLINEAEITEDYALMTIGLYCKPDDGDEVLYSICSLKDPIYMHKSSNNSTYSIDLNTLVGSAANVVIKVDPAGMVTNATFDAFKVTMGQQYALKSDLDAYLKELPANVALTGKANTFTQQQTLAGGATDGEGNAYATTKDVAIGLNNGLSTKVTDNKDGTIKANNLSYDLSKTGLTQLCVVKSGSFNDLPLGTVFAGPSMTDGPNAIHWFTTTTFLSSEWGGRKAQIAISDNTNHMYFRTGFNASTGISWNNWTLLSDNSKVAHLSGANNFDTVPTVNNNPLLLASSLPSDLARTGSDTNFTGKLQKSGIDVATTTDVTNAVNTATTGLAKKSDISGFYYQNADDSSAQSAAKSATTAGIYWFPES